MKIEVVYMCYLKRNMNTILQHWLIPISGIVVRKLWLLRQNLVCWLTRKRWSKPSQKSRKRSTGCVNLNLMLRSSLNCSLIAEIFDLEYGFIFARKSLYDIKECTYEISETAICLLKTKGKCGDLILPHLKCLFFLS